ncbi:uncharacterized protein [Struthio camelus]|uniref:uncharacterized protein isoform X4 n=1 Tax=Struthio camelus TaxID=8801 RepID=UPI003603C1DE
MYNTPEIASTLGEGCGRFKGSAEKASARSPCSSRTALGASQPLSRGRLWQQAPSLAAQPRSSPAVGKTAGHLLLTAWGLTPGGAACICRGRRGQPPAPEPGHPPGPSATAPWPTLCETAKQKYLLRAPACYASSLTICHRHQAFVYNNTNIPRSAPAGARDARRRENSHGAQRCNKKKRQEEASETENRIFSSEKPRTWSLSPAPVTGCRTGPAGGVAGSSF